MKKLITLLVTIAMIGVMLTGCGGSGKEVTADPAKLAEDLSKTASGDTLSSISEDILASTYLLDTSKIDSCAAYVGTGATACEAVVIKCSDSSYVSEVKGLFETRVKNQSDLYSSYNADEVKNLEMRSSRLPETTLFCVLPTTPQQLRKCSKKQVSKSYLKCAQKNISCDV